MSRPYIDNRLTRYPFEAIDRYAPGRYPSDDHRSERLIRRLPEHRQQQIRWLRGPPARWVRMPLGLLFILGGFLFILPIFGLWMLLVGLLLLAEDFPALRRLRTRILDWTECRPPHWFSEQHE